MKRKRLIIIGSVCTFLVLIIILCSTIFSLHSVRLEFRYTPTVLSESNAKNYVKSGNFDYGKNILFMNFKTNISNIESAHPYIKIIKIERKFPNKAVVHASERTPAFKALVNGTSNLYLVMDEDLKILNKGTIDSGSPVISGSLSEAEQRVPTLTLSGTAFGNTLTAGEFCKNDRLHDYISAFLDGFYAIDPQVNTSIMSNIAIILNSEEENGKTVFEFGLHNNIGLVVKIVGDDDLSEKVKLFMFVYKDEDVYSTATRIEVRGSTNDTVIVS